MARQSGQAAVETALTMPLMVFMMLGTLQLFLMLQARIMAEYAAFRAVRVGSVHHGNCEAMMDSAIASLMPTLNSFLDPNAGGTPGAKFANAFAARKKGGKGPTAYTTLPEDFPGQPKYAVGGGPRAIVWMVRDLCEGNACALIDEDDNGDFDIAGRPPTRLELQLIYWFPMRIPFANWVMAYSFAASQGFGDYTAQNPLLETQTANWQTATKSPYSMVSVNAALQAEFMSRLKSGQYSWPITSSYTMRMMTPARTNQAGYFDVKNCPPTPF